MRVDMVVTIGNVIQIAVTIAAVFLAYGAIKERLVRIETQLGPINDWWNQRAARRSADENGK